MDLLDLDFVGPRFTWFRGSLRERLDRGLATMRWRSEFPNSFVTHLPLLRSDHRPIMTCFFGLEIPDRSSRPFRFLVPWMAHEDFPGVLSSTWSSSRDARINLAALENNLRCWNRDSFGNIQQRKLSLLQHLAALEEEDYRNHPNAPFVEARIRKNLEHTIWEESALWAQKARTQWICDGDRNTRFCLGLHGRGEEDPPYCLGSVGLEVCTMAGPVKGMASHEQGYPISYQDGRGTYFWLTRWIDSGERLIDLLDGDPNLINQDDTVADLVGENGQWDWDKLSPHLPSDVLDKVAGMSPPKSEASDDDWIWGLQGNGRFSIRSAYNLIIPSRSKTRYCGAESGVGKGGCSKLSLRTLGCVLSPVLKSEGVLTGLRLAWEAGYKKVLVQMDSRAAIALLQDPNHVTHHHSIEVLQFRDLLTKDWTVEIRHIYREGN
ncbi:hypothetical protein LINPERHAP2_LOCUS18981 [Linum perenne]